MSNPKLVVMCVNLLTLIGCQTIPFGPATDDQKRTQTEATLLGAALGGLVGQLSTHDTEGTIIGTIVGGAAGSIAGAYLA